MAESRDSPNFWSTPYYFRNGQSYKLQIWQMYSEGSCEQKPIKNFGENGAWAYTGTAQIFWVPPIISGKDKATNFKFCTRILSIDQNNSPLEISGAVARCVVRTLKTFKCTHILGASRGLLCDSYAVLFTFCQGDIEIYCLYCYTAVAGSSTATWRSWASLARRAWACQVQTRHDHATLC